MVRSTEQPVRLQIPVAIVRDGPYACSLQLLGQTAPMKRDLLRIAGNTSRKVVLVASVTLAGAGLVVATSGAGADGTTSVTVVPLAGTTAAVPIGTMVLGPVGTSTRITVDVTLKPRDPAALEAFAKAISTPGNPRFHRYLAKGEFATLFGPTRTTLDATRSWLASTGLSLGTTSGDGLLVPVTGTAGQIESAFRVSLVRARLADGRTVRLGVRDPSVPALLASSLTSVVGLSDRTVAHPASLHSAPLAVPPSISSDASHGLVGPQACAAISNSNQIWTANKLAQTYGLSGLYAKGRVGAGQSIGIFEL